MNRASLGHQVDRGEVALVELGAIGGDSIDLVATVLPRTYPFNPDGTAAGNGPGAEYSQD